MRIIFPTKSGISTVIPAECGLTIFQIAQKDVPFGVPYLIVEDSSLPKDRTERNAYKADFSAPDGFGTKL